MATLRKRGYLWYGRIQWRDKNGQKKDKLIPLHTRSKVIAYQRLLLVNRVVEEIKNGMVFSFPWMNEEGHTKISVLTLKDAAEQWMKHCIKNGMAKNTLMINRISLSRFSSCIGSKRPLNSIDNRDVMGFVDFLKAKGNSDTTINIRLRTIKAMLRHFRKMEKIDRVPVIDQIKIVRMDPIYITDHEFQSLMDLDQLDGFYKRVFLLYRETGMRLREPFMASLNGNWIDIPPESKTKSARSIEVSETIKSAFLELKEWYDHGYGSTLVDPGDHISRIFKRHLRSIGVSSNKHFHSLRHTFAVRNLVMGVPIYDVKLMMGHSSVTTTERYSNMNLKRVAQDFPALVTSHVKSTINAMEDILLEDNSHMSSDYVPIYE